MNSIPLSRQRGSKETWLSAAYEVLTNSGVDAVKVMPLAKSLGLTRTSFYWHFKDREALLEAIIQCWEGKNTGNLLKQTRAYGENITEAMFNLFDCWLDDELFDARLDLAIRNWARTDTDLQARLDQADQQRLSGIIEMFKRYGFSQNDAEIRARTIIYTQIGYISMQITETKSTRVVHMPDYIELYTGQRPTPAEIDRFKARH